MKCEQVVICLLPGCYVSLGDSTFVWQTLWGGPGWFCWFSCSWASMDSPERPFYQVKEPRWLLMVPPLPQSVSPSHLINKYNLLCSVWTIFNNLYVQNGQPWLCRWFMLIETDLDWIVPINHELFDTTELKESDWIVHITHCRNTADLQCKCA